MAKLKVLFLAADPYAAEGAPLRLPEDMRQIRDKVLREAGRYVEFDFCLAAQPGDLIDALRDGRPDIVHFSCHGEAEGLLLIAPGGHGAHRVPADALVELFKTFPGDIRLVVLNACFSYEQAKAIAGVVGCAIGTRGEILDDVAITFGAAFYRAVARGLSVKAAFGTARAEVDVHHTDVNVRHELVPRRNVDPSALVLLPRGLWRWRRAIVRSGAALAFLVGALSGADILRLKRWHPPLPVVCETGGPAELGRPASSPEETAAAGQETGEAGDLHAGIALCEQGNYTEALQHFELAAKAGDAEAMGYLGIMYLGGHGTPRHPDTGLYWLDRGRDKRDGRAMNAIGELRERGIHLALRPDLAEHWYLAAAEEARFAPAMRNLGRYYLAEKRYQDALVWFQKAVDAGSRDAMVDLGHLYEEGVVGSPDEAAAFRWYRRAADRGSSYGMYSVGRAYHEGVGVARDYVQAKHWYCRAASAGSADAMSGLGMLYLKGHGVKKSRREAARWLRRAVLTRDGGRRRVRRRADAGVEGGGQEPPVKDWVGRVPAHRYVRRCRCRHGS